MNYQETLAYLFARLPMYQRVGKAAYKADLSNTLALMEITGHPEQGLRCVHVAGTNGKGSTSHMIASVLQESGYSVGLHTSPHLKDFRERFRINGEVITEAAVVRFVEEFHVKFEPIDASFFEWGVALALWWFNDSNVDIAVIETGMGGRLDSTNVILPEVSVITNIGLDHMEFLGTTVEAIAAEKAGIIKPGTPVVLGEANASVRRVIQEKASLEKALITLVDQQTPQSYKIELKGEHQQRNARTTVAALNILREKNWAIPEQAIAKGLMNVVKNTGLVGRWQQLSAHPGLYVDVAHNADGFRVISAMLKDLEYRILHIVLGMVNDKDLFEALQQLPASAKYYYCKADIPRGLEAEELMAQASRIGLKGAAYRSVQTALDMAKNNAGSNDLILVTGSVFVVAEAI